MMSEGSQLKAFEYWAPERMKALRHLHVWADGLHQPGLPHLLRRMSDLPIEEVTVEANFFNIEKPSFKITPDVELPKDYTPLNQLFTEADAFRSLR